MATPSTPASWRPLVARARAEYARNLGPTQRRIVRVLLVLAAVLLVGLTLTGIWQFFFHPPDPTWSTITPDKVDAAAPAAERGGATFHGLFSTLLAMLALIGGAVFTLAVAQRLPRVVPIFLVVVVAAVFTGHLIRFNAVKPEGGPPTDTRGYLQIFDGGNDYVLTDLRAYSTTSIVALTLLHLAMLPLLALAAWYGLRRLSRPDPDDRSAERVGWDVRGLGGMPAAAPEGGRRPAGQPGDAGWRRPDDRRPGH